MEQAEGTTERRRQLECEKADSEELQQKYKRNQEREAAKNQSVADLKANLHCDLCDKQYSRHTDFDNHMSSQDHAHKQRLKTLRQREFGRNVSCQKHKESRTVEKLQRRMNDFADARVKKSSQPAERSPSAIPLKADQPRSTVNSVPVKSDNSPSKNELSAPKVEKSASVIESPASKVNMPTSTIELPASKVESSPSKVELSPTKIEQPASKLELSPSTIDLPPSEIELPPSKTKTSSPETPPPVICKTEQPELIDLPPPKAEVAPSDIELPPSEIELFLSELEMAPAAIPPPESLPITTVFYTDGSSDAPPLPAPSDDAGSTTPDVKADTQHDTSDVKDSPGKSGVVSFTFAKKTSTLLLPGAVFAKTGKKVPGKGKRGHENSGSETSPVREGYHSSPPLNCKAKPQLDFVRFVHSDGRTGAAKENTGAGGDVAGDNGDTGGDTAVTKKLLEFHSVTSADDTRQLPWPGEMVQHTHVAPSITFCCNPLYFDFTQLRAKPSHAKESHANGDVIEEAPVEKKKSHKKHSKKSRSHRSRSERKKRKLLQEADTAGKTEDNGSAGEEHKATGTPHKSKKHKHRKSKRSKRHGHESIGDGGVEGERKDSSGKKHNEKEDTSVADGKKPHKGKKKKSHRSKKDKKSSIAETASSEKGSAKDESNTKSTPGKEKKKKSEREKKSCEEESSKESELDETAATADGKKKRKYRKRKHTASCHPDSSDDEGTAKTSKGTKKMAVPMSFKRKGISSTSELSDNAKETKLLEAKLQKNKKQKVNLVDAIVSSHVHIGDVKAAKSADCVLPVPHVVGVELVKAPKVPGVTGTIGKMQQVPVKNDDQNCDSKNKPKEVGKSKWDTSSDSDLDNAGPVMAKAMATLADTTEANKDVDHVVSSHSNRSSVRSRKNSGQSEKAKSSAVHRSDRSESSNHEDGDKVTKRKGHGKDHSGSKHSRSRSRSASSKRRSRSYSTDSKYDDGRSRSRSYSSDDYSDDYDRRRSHTRTPSRDRRRSRSHTRTPSRDRRWSRTPSRRRSHSRDSRRSRHGRRSYSSYSRSRSRSNSYSRRSRRRKSRSYSGGRHRHHRSYSRSYSRSRSRSSYSRSRSRSHSPVGSHGRHWPFSREHRYNSATVKSLLPKQKAPAVKRGDVAKNQKPAVGDAAKSSTSSDLLKKSESSSDTASKSTGDEGKASHSKDTSSTTVVDPSKIPTPTADSIPLPPSGKGKTAGRSAASQQAESIPLPDAPADDNSPSNIFQPIGPNDPLVFKVPLPPPPPPTDGAHAKSDSSMPPPPPLPDGVAPSGSVNEGKTTEAFMIPPEQVERYKQLQQQAQIHARARVQAQRRLEAGYENDSDEEDVEEEDPQQQLMLDTMDMQQMEMLPQQLLIPHASPQPMHHVMSLSPGGMPASLAGFMPSAHTLSGLQQAVHMVPQAGAPVMVAAPSAGAGHLMHQMMPSSIVHVMGPGGVPIAVQQLPSQQQLLQQQLLQQQQQQQLMHQQLLQQQMQQQMQQPMFIQAGGAPGLIHASQTAVMPQLVPVAQQLPNGQVIVGQQVVMSRVLRPHM
ncbi:hypothetical protein NP493_525g06069 [Ridgeia piscesae]|uniref:C2H2-type domain-containing protein n=1 Tax=Ridgeia piscesae TaxID=27915 RepID=A0AAD9KX36_RIDPI|nr:hypothetical protein NP493_525g06069 [Ridgeia piscesae]